MLPLVVDVPGHDPQLFEFEDEDVLRVPITHPDGPVFDGLGMQWCAVPAIANFRLEIGGIEYGCLPFNGWFMGTEIARNLFEEKRYDRAEAIAEALGLDTSSEATLWRDRAFLELNAAVISSFQKARVTLVDHQTASRQFMIHEMREKRAGRECPAQWSWIVPPVGGSTTPVWHHDMRDFQLKPAFRYAADRWVVSEGTRAPERDGRAVARDKPPLVLFASETGTAETYARMAGRFLGRLAPAVLPMDDAVRVNLAEASFVFLITSTHRDGEVPTNGRAMLRWLQSQPPKALANLQFAVLGIGNRIYPNFCAAAQAFDTALSAAGAERAVALTLADEIAGQADTVKQWIEMISKLLGGDGGRVEPVARPRLEVASPVRRPAVDPESTAAVALNDELLPGAPDDRSTREVVFALDETAAGPVDYRPGDHLALMPRNAAAQISRMCVHLGLQPTSWFRVTQGPEDRYGRFREPYPVEQLLGEDLDLALPETPEELLAAMRDAAGDPSDREVLDKWIGLLEMESSDPARQRHKDWMRDNFITVPDLFDNFPNCCPPLEVLIDILPKLRPRLYSIASSPRVEPGRVRIIASNLRYAASSGQSHEGVASHYLRQLPAGARVRIAVKPAHRQLPADFAGPLLLIGAGTGLSLLYGVLEDRAARRIAGGPGRTVRLYFGCRNQAEFLMRDQLLAWRARGRHRRRHRGALARDAGQGLRPGRAERRGRRGARPPRRAGRARHGLRRRPHGAPGRRHAPADPAARAPALVHRGHPAPARAPRRRPLHGGRLGGAAEPRRGAGRGLPRPLRPGRGLAHPAHPQARHRPAELQRDLPILTPASLAA